MIVAGLERKGAADRSISGRSVETVVAAIRDHIRRQKLLPGEQVRQSDWADRVGVSRVPVREALNSLALAGVLAHDRHRGFFLTKYTQAELAQLYFVRGVLEVEIARSIDWPSVKEVKKLRKSCAVMQDAARVGDAPLWLQAHEDFHSALIYLSPLRVLVEEAERLWIRTESFRSMRTHNALAEGHSDHLSHNEIIAALVARDRELLIKLFTLEMRVKDSDLTKWTTRRGD